MQRRFQPRTLASCLGSLLIHALLLGWLSFAFTEGQGGRVALLDVLVVPGPQTEKQTERPKPRRLERPPVAEDGTRPAPPPEPSVEAASREPLDPGVRSSYFAQLRAAIESSKSYPALARARRQEGRVELAFTLRKDGSITDIAVTRSSTFSTLDEAGMSTLSRLARFKPIPDDVSRGDLRLVLPIEFRLEN